MLLMPAEHKPLAEQLFINHAKLKKVSNNKGTKHRKNCHLCLKLIPMFIGISRQRDANKRMRIHLKQCILNGLISRLNVRYYRKDTI